jgi:hypothetical protein
MKTIAIYANIDPNDQLINLGATTTKGGMNEHLIITILITTCPVVRALLCLFQHYHEGSK